MASTVDTPFIANSFGFIKQTGWNKRILTENDLKILCEAFQIEIITDCMMPQGKFITRNGRSYIVINKFLSGTRALFVSFHCVAHAIMHLYLFDVFDARLPSKLTVHSSCNPLDDIQNGIVYCGPHGAYPTVFASVALMPRLALVSQTHQLIKDDVSLSRCFIKYRQGILTQYGL